MEEGRSIAPPRLQLGAGVLEEGRSMSLFGPGLSISSFPQLSSGSTPGASMAQVGILSLSALFSSSGQLITHLGSDFPPGAGVLDVMYESPSTLLSCGYDTYVRYWDLRTSTRKCVMEWEEPHDSTFYCLQTDGNHLLATGSSYYGLVRLWDRRQRACLHVSATQCMPLGCQDSLWVASESGDVAKGASILLHWSGHLNSHLRGSHPSYASLPCRPSR